MHQNFGSILFWLRVWGGSWWA